MRNRNLLWIGASISSSKTSSSVHPKQFPFHRYKVLAARTIVELSTNSILGSSLFKVYTTAYHTLLPSTANRFKISPELVAGIAATLSGALGGLVHGILSRSFTGKSMGSVSWLLLTNASFRIDTLHPIKNKFPSCIGSSTISSVSLWFMYVTYANTRNFIRLVWVFEVLLVSADRESGPDNHRWGR